MCTPILAVKEEAWDQESRSLVGTAKYIFMAASNCMSSLSLVFKVLNVLPNCPQPNAGCPSRHLDFSEVECCQNTQLLLDLGKTLQ